MKRFQMLYPRISLVLFAILLVFLMSVLTLDFSQGIFNNNIANTLAKMWVGLVNLDLSSATLSIAFRASLQTLVYSIVALSLTLVFSLILGVLGSGVLFEAQWIASLSHILMRFARSIHELIWAWFFVYAMGNNPIAGLLALTIPYSGGLGKQFSDSILSVNQEQITSLASTGASRLQQLIYGYLPTAFMDMLTFTIFRFEMAVRSTTVLSFIGLGGLGFYIQLAAQDLNYDTLWTYLILLILIVSIINIWGESFRKQVTAHES